MGPTTWPTSRAKAVSAKHRAGPNHAQPLRLQGIPWETESYGTVKLGGILGHANRIKSLTRQTFERAKVELLRRQVPLHG